MKILFVGEVTSIHTARWINQFCDTGWDIHLFQAIVRHGNIIPELKTGTVYVPFPQRTATPPGITVAHTLGAISEMVPTPLSPAQQQVYQWLHTMYLARLIQELQPEVMHSLGLNVYWTNLCLPVLQACRVLGGTFNAPWIYSSWGADLMHYARLSPDHYAEVKSILAAVDYYIAECHRDERIAREMGFQGEFLGYLPAFGGINWDEFYALRQPGPVAARKTIVLKGRDEADGDPQGRALTVLHAFALCADLLQEYEIVIVQAGATVARAVTTLKAAHGLTISLPPQMSYTDWLRVMGRSRVMVALTVSDGLPGTLVEALTMGTFPIHSNLESIREWIQHGENGLLVPFDNPQAIADALCRALSDADLVEHAAELNARIVTEKLVTTVVTPRAIALYESVAHQRPIRKTRTKNKSPTQATELMMIYKSLQTDLEQWITDLHQREFNLNEREADLDLVASGMFFFLRTLIRKSLKNIFHFLRKVHSIILSSQIFL